MITMERGEQNRGRVEVVTGHDCGTCNQWFKESSALKPGVGICLAHTESDYGVIEFSEIYDSCMDWEPR